MKIYKSIVSESLLQEFPIQGPSSFMNYAANCVGLPETLAIAGLFWPRIVEKNGMIFLTEFSSLNEPVAEEISPLEIQRNERIMNAVSLGQLLHSEKLEILENEKLLDAFGEALKFFWLLRLQTLFPEKEFVVEIGTNIAGEEGQVITFYQKRV